MRLNLYWRGRDVLDIEAHLWRKREEDDDTEEPPKLTAAPACSDISRAEPMEYPDTTAFGFGR